MPQIPLPERGQPLDVAFLYEIARSINDLNNTVAANLNSSSKIREVSNRPTSGLNVYAQEISSFTPGAKTAGAVETTTVIFGVSFQYPPVVFATPIVKDASPASQNTTVYVRDITTTQCTIGLRYGTSGQADVDVNVFAIGIPA